MNPFDTRAPSLLGPFTDIVPITPDDATDLPVVAVAIYAESGGYVAIRTLGGAARLVELPDHGLLPVGLRGVNATGTTATGLHALLVV